MYYGKGLSSKELYEEIYTTCKWPDTDDACNELLGKQSQQVGPYTKPLPRRHLTNSRTPDICGDGPPIRVLPQRWMWCHGPLISVLPQRWMRCHERRLLSSRSRATSTVYADVRMFRFDDVTALFRHQVRITSTTSTTTVRKQKTFSLTTVRNKTTSHRQLVRSRRDSDGGGITPPSIVGSGVVLD